MTEKLDKTEVCAVDNDSLRKGESAYPVGLGGVWRVGCPLPACGHPLPLAGEGRKIKRLRLKKGLWFALWANAFSLPAATRRPNSVGVYPFETVFWQKSLVFIVKFRGIYSKMLKETLLPRVYSGFGKA